MSVESKLCDGMGYEHCVLFSRARVAIAWMVYRYASGPQFIPSNVCPALANALGNPILMPVGSSNGMAESAGVQLYGFRKEGASVEIDPLMTGWRRETAAQAAIISFGYSKIIDIGYGGAFLTNDAVAAKEMEIGDWGRDDKTEQLDYELDRLDEVIKRRKERLALWDMYLPAWCIKPDLEPVMPWRVIRRIKNSDRRERPSNRDYIAELMRGSGFNAGTNYPPLPGCTDPSSVEWGNTVINFWLDDDPIKAREILNTAMGI